MKPRDARLVLREARSWADEGLLDADAYRTLEARYASLADQADEDAGFASRALYGVGGVLLGAAAIALVTFLDVRDVAHLWFLGLGALGVLAGVAARATGNPDFGDALLVASLVPFAAIPVPMPGPDRVGALAIVSVLAPLALAYARREARLVPAAAAISFMFGSAFASFMTMDAAEPGAQAWALLVAAFLVAATLAGRAWQSPWRPEVLGVGAVGAAAATIAILVTANGSMPSGGIQLVVGAVQLVILMAGLGLREKGFVVGAAGVLTVDAIAFAFDVGGVLLGTGVLVLVAAVMLWQAEMIRRFVSRPVA